MKNSIFIVILCFIQGACASMDPVTAANRASLISQQIAAEISVRFEVLQPAAGTESVTAQIEVAAN